MSQRALGKQFEEPANYKVRVGADGRWHYNGDNWLEATKTAGELHTRTGRAEIFAYRGNKQIGKRTWTIHPDPIHAERGTPLIKQEGEMR